jgi:uncharacterized protein
VGVFAAVLAIASPAFAHVTVSGAGATQGGYATLTFTVPTESDTASTTKLTVTLPSDEPIASVSVQPKPGWTHTETEVALARPLTDDDGNQITKAVGSITWTATADAAIKPGEFDTFNVSAGPLPAVDALAFAAEQTYSDGTVVNWNEVAAPGSSEPDHPKPTLTLAAASAAPASSSGKSGSDTTALVLSIIALVLAAGAVGGTVVSRARTRHAAVAE